MNGDQLDALVRSLAASPSRRRALRLLVGSALSGLVGLRAGMTQAKKGGGKKGGGKKGGGKKDGGKDGGGKNGGGKGNGNPGPPPPPDPPPPVSCVGKPDGTACGGGKQCSGEVCATPPGCTNGPECSGAGDCCSGNCADLCQLSTAGEPCTTGSDCWSGNCVGFACGPRVCPAAGDFCQNMTQCGTGGLCLRPIDGGVSRCGSAPFDDFICGCTSHQQCVATHGQGAFCAQTTGNNCGYCANNPGSFCFVPVESVYPS